MFLKKNVKLDFTKNSWTYRGYNHFHEDFMDFS